MTTIRDATSNDIPQLASLLRAANQDVAQQFNLTPTNCPSHPSNCQPQWIKDSMAKGVDYYLLEDESPACGCVALEQVQTDVAYLERLAVLPQHQNKGYGRMLVEYIFIQAQQQGIKRIEIAIISSHLQLKRWYENLGFTTSHTKSFKHLPFDVTFMAVNL